MKISLIISCSLIIVGSLLWGCKQSNQTSNPVTDTVIISGMKFNPEVLVVNKNDTIVWINDGLVSHNVAADSGMQWKSDTIPAGSSWKRVVDEDLNYFCSIHPTMKGKIVINK